ncbi:M43 family zinc metalloprotease [Chryseolinea sp. T2]|uniref:M43 family zinc metalloprotease n=1 Tax=Chryseolinea sp. T2 TaxID=3129255 RepID=UPI0030780033
MTFTKSPSHLKYIVVIVIALMHRTTFAQDRCGTVDLLVKKRGASVVRETDEQFEQWMNERTALRKKRSGRTSAYIIPVVFHVIHKGESVGSGVNIPDAQLISQIAVLNRDYNRTNIDASSTPAEFASTAGSMNIVFVLAKQDPNGNPTSGIVRVKGSKSQYSTNDESALKSISYWPAEDYLNIWVTDLSSTLLGYAQFPISDLAGLEDAEDNRLTDGVVLDYSVVGSNEDGTFNLSSNFNKGRSATHEVGHFFGLRHIWGDDNGSCSGNGDYVSDTPNQANSTDGCPSHPQTTCSLHSMFQNYMDYTNDACMNLFTAGQVSRMTTVIESSPRRASLLISNGAYDPAPAANDLAVVSIVSPSANLCETSVTPVVRIVNKGSNVVARATIAFAASGDTVVSNVVLPHLLSSGDSATVSLDNFDFTSGNNSLLATVVTVNGEDDSKPSDNSVTGSTYVYFAATIPYRQTFDQDPEDWKLLDETLAWETNAGATGSTLYVDAFNATISGEATAITPRFTLSTSSTFLIFDVAYASLSASDATRLAVYALGVCSDDISTGTLLFSKTGSDLATSPASSSVFAPTTVSWRQEVIDLSALPVGQPVRFAFVMTTAQGNNLYIDNVHVADGVAEDVQLADVTDFSPVSCTSERNVNITIRNKGTHNLDQLQVGYSVNGVLTDVKTFDNLAISAGSAAVVSINDILVTETTNTIEFQLLRPNGLFDVQASNDSFTITTAVNGDQDIIPLRQTFDNGMESWTSISPYGGTGWQLNTGNADATVSLNASNVEDIRSAWLASPVLDFSSASEASLFFDYASLRAATGSGSRADSSDTLKIMVSTDCGASYVAQRQIPLSVANDSGVPVASMQ